MSKSRPVKFYILTVLMMLISVFLVACGDNTATPVPATTVAPTKAATTAAATTAAATTSATTTAAAATTTAAAATTVAAATTGAATSTAPLVIGMINSRTGALAGYGKMVDDSWPAAIEYFTKGTGKIAGREVKLVVEDDAGDANKAVEAARKLVQQDKAEILVGTVSSAAAIQVAAVNEKELKKIFIVDPAADQSVTGAAFNKYTFRTARNTDQDAAAGAPYAVELASKKNKKIAHIYQDYAFGQGANVAWKEIATKTAGIQWTEVAVPLTATDYTPYIQKVLDAAPDVLVLNWAGATAIKLFQQMKDNDIYSKMALVSPIGDAKATVKSQGDTVIGAVGVGIYWHQFPKNAENDFLVKYYKEKYNTFPDVFDTSGMNLVSAINSALTKTNGDTDPEKLITVMEGMSFPSAKGTLTFRKEDHQALQPMYLVEMTKDTTGTFGFPVPKLLKELSAQESAPPIRRK